MRVGTAGGAGATPVRDPSRPIYRARRLGATCAYDSDGYDSDSDDSGDGSDSDSGEEEEEELQSFLDVMGVCEALPALASAEGGDECDAAAAATWTCGACNARFEDAWEWMDHMTLLHDTALAAK